MCLKLVSQTKPRFRAVSVWLLAHHPAKTQLELQNLLSSTCSPATRSVQEDYQNRQRGPCGHRLVPSAVNCGRDLHSFSHFLQHLLSSGRHLFQAQPETLLKIKILFYPNSFNWSTWGKLKTHKPHIKTGRLCSEGDLPANLTSSQCCQPSPGGIYGGFQGCIKLGITHAGRTPTEPHREES